MKPVFFSWLLVTVLMVPVFTGCDFRRVVVNDPLVSELVEELVPGKSPVQEVVQKLGAPDDITEGATGIILRYRYGDTKTLRVNFGWIVRVFFPLAPPMNLGRGEGVTHILHVALNSDLTFDHSVVQSPPESPHFWFWPF